MYNGFRREHFYKMRNLLISLSLILILVQLPFGDFGPKKPEEKKTPVKGWWMVSHFAVPPTQYSKAGKGMVVFGRGRVFRIMGGAEPSGFRIEYIWASHLPKGHIFDHPGEKYCKVFVLESGEGKAGHWVTEKRNLHKDYKSAFGTDPEGVSAIGIQTDTDHSNERVIAYYSVPTLRKR
jgi:hypothetical protein